MARFFGRFKHGLDAKGRVIALGKKRGFPSRILDWTPQQVTAAYRAARALASR